MLIVGLSAAGALIFIWLGYAFLIRIAGAVRAAPGLDESLCLPSVSVILATRDESATISNRVADLLKSDYPEELLRVVVALDSTREPSHPSLYTFPAERVRVVDGDLPGGKSATLNAGVRAATSDVLVFADAAQTFHPDAIRMLVSALARPRVGAVSGMLDIPAAAGSRLNLPQIYWRFERWLRKWEARAHSCVGVTGAIYAMPRRLWEPLPPNLILDDVYVPMRLALQGFRIDFEPRAQATDVRRFVPAQEYRRKVRTLTGVIQVCAWLPGVLNPARNPLWLPFVFHKLLRLLTPYLALLAVLGIAWSVVSLLLSLPGGVEALLSALVLVGILCLVPRVRRVLMGQLEWGLALQSSTVVATVNGLRGRWDVWR